MNQKEIKKLVDELENGFTQTFESLKLGTATKKIRKLIARAAKRIGKEVKANLKQEAKRLKQHKKSILKKASPKKKAATKPVLE
ncbi:MAG: hypothetical protein KF763_15515 [Cyclobacteriaceae bacterium]|nr:hypothetical protein [Cyclobacteriaceae bacterium]